jgi:hypothetical protein
MQYDTVCMYSSGVGMYSAVPYPDERFWSLPFVVDEPCLPHKPKKSEKDPAVQNCVLES